MTKVSDVNLIHLEYISRVLKTRINPTFHELQHYLLIMGGNGGIWESGTPKINPPKKICFPFPYDIGTV